MNKREELCLKIETAVALLEQYNGEEIVAHEHPLHLAIQEVEKLCRERFHGPQSTSKQTHSLTPAARNVWYALLDCSRGHLHSRRLSSVGCDWWSVKKDSHMDEILPQDEWNRKKVLAIMLSVALKSMATILQWYDACGGDLPIKPKSSSADSCW